MVFNKITVVKTPFISNYKYTYHGQQCLSVLFLFLHYKLRACMLASLSTALSLRLSHHPLFVLACRIVELFPAVPINPHWGIVSKCLTYSKAACDPFVYSLLRHQYRKTCTDIINRLLKRSSLNASGPRQVNQVNSIPTAE